MSIIEDTMVGILDALRGGGWAHYLDVQASVLANGGKVERMPEARKRLRDMGVPITCRPARHMTMWTSEPDDVDQEADHNVRIHSAYSRNLSAYRSLVGAQQAMPSMATFRGLPAVEQAVFFLGRACGMSLQDVVADLTLVPQRAVTWP